MEVLMLGTEVIVGDDIPAKITGICIKPGSITYECSWWSGRDKKLEWMYDFEFKEVISHENIKIGFKNV